jgi:hypothetical protein
MKIIDIGICVDNVDPLGIGRIRCSRYNDITAQKERALEYDAWDDNDLFTANPFLPLNINFVPEIGQSVKIISYDPRKENVNVEYVAGPFTSMYDFNGQTYSQQIAHTSYGVNVEKKPPLKDKSGKFLFKDSENVFANNKDFAIYGKSGSDILFTEGGLQLRGGKLLSKETGNNKKREKMIDYPIMANKSSKLYLKKFPKKMSLENEPIEQTIFNDKDLNYLIEYTISGNTTSGSNNLTGLNPSTTYPTTISLYVYKIINPLGDTFKTNFFNEHSESPFANLKLINLNGGANEATYSTNITNVNNIYIDIRNKLFEIDDLGLVELDDNYNSDDLHPYYFRPSKNFRNLVPSTGATQTIEAENKDIILRNVNVRRVGPTSGLVYSTTSSRVTSEQIKSSVDKIKIIDNSPEQTFGAVVSDKIYFLSTDLGTNESPIPVPFNNLDKYEFTQEDYIKRIDPYTYSTVRGENLLEVLRKIIDVMLTHRHNPLMPIVNQFDYQDGNELKELYKTLENDILNKSIRIN